MNINKRARILVGAVALAGTVAFAGNAFTGTGVTDNAGASQFVGGTIDQDAVGATLSTIAYSFTDPTNTQVSSVLLSFADDKANGQTVSVKVNAASTVYSCSLVSSTNNFNCDLTGAPMVDALHVSVSSSNPIPA